jgi:hypothetical protein
VRLPTQSFFKDWQVFGLFLVLDSAANEERYTCLIAILCVTLLVHGLGATQCVSEADGLQPTITVLGTLLSNNEHTRMYAASDISS